MTPEEYQREIERREELIHGLDVDLREARAQAAELRAALEAHRDNRFDGMSLLAASAEQDKLAAHALSSDCGKGWVSPEDAARVREALEVATTHRPEDREKVRAALSLLSPKGG